MMTNVPQKRAARRLLAPLFLSAALMLCSAGWLPGTNAASLHAAEKAKLADTGPLYAAREVNPTDIDSLHESKDSINNETGSQNPVADRLLKNTGRLALQDTENPHEEAKEGLNGQLAQGDFAARLGDGLVSGSSTLASPLLKAAALFGHNIGAGTDKLFLKGRGVGTSAQKQENSDPSQSRPDEQKKLLYAKGKNANGKNPAAEKRVYLTFDDGPSANTAEVLNILRREGIKATFFVLGEQAESRPELVARMNAEGHAIGNHTYNHDYSELYGQFSAFWSQIKRTEDIIHGIAGYRTRLVRAPGGTYGHFDSNYFGLMQQAGYLVTDWNVDSGDSKRRGVPAKDIIQASIAAPGSADVVLLLHDGAGHQESVKALPQIIRHYRNAGYTFAALDPSLPPVQFRVSSKLGKYAGRTAPGAAWVAAHVAPNAALFAPGQPLRLEVGRQEAKLDAGEYRIIQGRISVPLRTVTERLGGTAVWDARTRTGIVHLGQRRIEADAGRGELRWTAAGTARTLKHTEVQMIGDKIWIPLRELLEASGHPPLSVTAADGERRVKAR